MNKSLIKQIKGSNLLPFLFFLLVSGCLWLLQTLNEKYETDIPFTVHIGNVPSDMKLEEGNNYELRAVLRDNGTVLVGYKFDDNPVINVNYKEFGYNNGRLTLPASAVKNKVLENLEPSTSLVNFLSDTIVFNIKKDVRTLPVKVDTSRLKVAGNCELLHVAAIPDKVTVVALPGVLSDEDSVMTEPITDIFLNSTKEMNVRLVSDNYVTLDPSSVKVVFDVAQLEHRSVRVQLLKDEFPLTSDEAALPVFVYISFEVAKSDADKVSPSDFAVMANFKDYLNTNTDSVKLHLEKSPEYARNVVLTPSALSKRTIEYPLYEK